MIIPKISNQTKVTSKGGKTSFDALEIDCHPTDNIKSADIAVVGDFPSEIDVIKQELFSDHIGGQFNRICSAVRLARHNIYITSACKADLKKKKHTVLWTAKGYKHPDWGTLQKRLIDELAEFPGKVILLLGETPLRLLIDHPRFQGIGKYRGSFYEANQFPHLKDKLTNKIIGLSYHPNFTMAWGQPVHFYTMIADFKKALAVNEDPEILNKNLIKTKIKPTFNEVMDFYKQIKETR